MPGERYFIKGYMGEYKEVTLEEWCKAERRAGFHSKSSSDTPATAGFNGNNISGTMIFEGSTPEQWYWNPELVAIAWPDYKKDTP